MKNKDFIKGIGIGMVAGAAVSMMCMPKKKRAKTTAGRMVKTASRILNDVQDTMCL